LIAAAEEERFSRRKHDASLPVRAFTFCLDQAGIGIGDIDCIAYFEDPMQKLHRQLWMGLPDLPLASARALGRLDATRPEREVRERLGYLGHVFFTEHHRAHAASSYYYSGFPEAAILTVDGVGEWTTTSYGLGRGKGLSLLEEVRFPHLVGLLYSTVTAYLGFGVNDGEYKVMGLAPYGQPAFANALRRLIRSAPGGQYTLDMQYFDLVGEGPPFTSKLCELLGEGPIAPDAEPTAFACDLARSERGARSHRLDHVPRRGRAQRRPGRGNAVPAAVRPCRRRLVAGPVGAGRCPARAAPTRPSSMTRSAPPVSTPGNCCPRQSGCFPQSPLAPDRSSGSISAGRPSGSRCWRGFCSRSRRPACRAGMQAASWESPWRPGASRPSRNRQYRLNRQRQPDR
jgi:Carbamoyltransferase N-terminus